MADLEREEITKKIDLLRDYIVKFTKMRVDALTKRESERKNEKKQVKCISESQEKTNVNLDLKEISEGQDVKVYKQDQLKSINAALLEARFRRLKKISERSMFFF